MFKDIQKTIHSPLFLIDTFWILVMLVYIYFDYLIDSGGSLMNMSAVIVATASGIMSNTNYVKKRDEKNVYLIVACILLAIVVISAMFL